MLKKKISQTNHLKHKGNRNVDKFMIEYNSTIDTMLEKKLKYIQALSKFLQIENISNKLQGRK